MAQSKILMTTVCTIASAIIMSSCAMNEVKQEAGQTQLEQANDFHIEKI